MQYFKPRGCKKIDNYFKKTKLNLSNQNSLKKKNKPYNLKLLKEAIQTFIYRESLKLHPSLSLKFILDPKLRQYLIENYQLSKRY